MMDSLVCLACAMLASVGERSLASDDNLWDAARTMANGVGDLPAPIRDEMSRAHRAGELYEALWAERAAQYPLVDKWAADVYWVYLA